MLEDWEPFNQQKLIPIFFERKRYYFFFGAIERPFEIIKHFQAILFTVESEKLKVPCYRAPIVGHPQKSNLFGFATVEKHQEKLILNDRARSQSCLHRCRRNDIYLLAF